MAEKIRAEEGAIEKGAAAVENARLGIDNRIKDIESKMAELGSFWSGDNLRGTAKDQAANEEDNQSRTSKLQSLLG